MCVIYVRRLQRRAINRPIGKPRVQLKVLLFKPVHLFSYMFQSAACMSPKSETMP